MESLIERFSKLMTVKSLVTLILTVVFAVLAVSGRIAQDFMTVYAVVIAFYFGTQSMKGEGGAETINNYYPVEAAGTNGTSMVFDRKGTEPAEANGTSMIFSRNGTEPAEANGTSTVFSRKGTEPAEANGTPTVSGRPDMEGSDETDGRKEDS